MYSYCSSIYGSQLWDLTCDRIAYLCVSLRRGLKNIWKRPINARANILFGLCGKRPIEAELRYRTLSFIYRCINSDNNTVRSVARHKLSATDRLSTLAKNYVHCRKYFGIRATIPELDRNFDYSSLL